MNRNDTDSRFLNLIATMTCALPALAILLLWMVGRPDLESWLAAKDLGFGRSDAFEGVNRVAPAFLVTLLTATIFGCYATYRRHGWDLVLLAAGPLFCTLWYLADYGISDPAWMSFLSLNTIGMFVSILVTSAWILVRHLGAKRRLESNRSMGLDGN